MTALPVLVPERRRGREILDDPGIDPALAERSLRDVARSNALFGGARAVLGELWNALESLGVAQATMLDVGSGVGDIARRASAEARHHGVTLGAIGLEQTMDLTCATRRAVGIAVCGDALALPFADHSVDIVTCSQVLHHFPDETAGQLLRELNRVARHRVIVADLRRSWIAIAGLWTASFPLRFHPVSRHDGIVSIRRGYTAPELAALVMHAVGRAAVVRARAGFRVTASWSPI